MSAFQEMHERKARLPICVTNGQTDKTDGKMDGKMDGQTDDGQSDPYVPLCFAGDTKRQTDRITY